MRRAPVGLLVAALVALVALSNVLAAQSVRVVRKGRDSALVIVRANCTTCDSVRYAGRLSDAPFARVLRPGAVDTLRTRGGALGAFTPPAMAYMVFKTTRVPFTIPAIMLDTIAEYRVNGGAWQQDKHATITTGDTLETRLAIYNAARLLVGEVQR